MKRESFVITYTAPSGKVVRRVRRDAAHAISDSLQYAMERCRGISITHEGRRVNVSAIIGFFFNGIDRICTRAADDVVAVENGPSDASEPGRRYIITRVSDNASVSLSALDVEWLIRGVADLAWD